MALLVAACEGPQSALDPAGPVAGHIAVMWWIMLAGAAAIFGLVLAMLALAFRRRERPRAINERRWLIGWGLIFPVVTLSTLLVYALGSGELLLPRQDANAFRVAAQARQFQWEFSYPDHPQAPSGEVLHLPVGRPVIVEITSADVIHSFWIPRLAGKIDAIPGHTNHIRLTADSPGLYQGQCAEFCGVGHTDMRFTARALADMDLAAFTNGEAVQ